MFRVRSLLVVVAATALLPVASATAEPASADPAPSLTRAEAPLPANVEAFMKAYRAWGAAPTVDAYLNLFTPDGTLMDSGLPQPIGYDAIRKQMIGVLSVVPDYRFDPFSVTASPDGRVLFVKARNTGTVQGARIDYFTMHRLVLRGAQVEQGRRFWDQTELFRPLAPQLRNLFEGLNPTTGVAPAAAGSTTGARGREQAWNTQCAPALAAGVDGPIRLTGPGLTAGLDGRAAAREYLGRFFSEVHSLDLRRDHTVRQGGTTYTEWVGHATVGPERRTLTYGIVERFTRNERGGTDWELSFDTLDLVATQAEIVALRKLIFG